MKSKFGLDEKPTRSNRSRACFQRAPWNEKLALVLVADEVSWPACLFILKYLMQKIIEIEKQEDRSIMTSKASPHMETFTGDKDDFKFHHYFDLVCGADVGGLAAVMLGHLRLSLEEADEKINSLLDYSSPGLLKLFGMNQRSESSRQLHTNLHHALEPAATKSSLATCNSPRDVCRENASQFLSVPGMCQTLVFGAVSRIPSSIHVFRSYQQFETRDGHSMNEDTIPVPLVNVCRVTMADPSRYEHVDVRLNLQKPAQRMARTSARNIDLTGLIIDEVEHLYSDTSSLRCLLQLGGLPNKSSSSNRACWPFRKAQSNDQHLEVKSALDSKNLNKIRVSGLKILAGYISKGSLTEAERHCRVNGLYDQLEDHARTLVEARRSRARSLQWETFAFSDRYSCSICRKKDHDTGILDEPAFLDHVESVHDFYHLPRKEMFQIQEESLMEL